MESVLITGVAGFIGSHVAKRFVEEGFRVIGVDDLSQGSVNNIPNDISFIEADLSNDISIKKLPRDCKKILHLAGQSSGEISFDNPILDLQKNTVSTLRLIQFGIQNHAERFVYASSMSVYGDVNDVAIDENNNLSPLSCYGVGKLAAEEYLKIYQKQLPFVSLRMFNVYGPGQDMKNLRQGMVSIYLSQAINNGKIIVKGSTDRFRDFIHIDDVVESWYRASFSNAAMNENINIATGVRTSVKELLDEICIFIPESSIIVDGVTKGDQKGIYADITKMQSTLGFSPKISLTEGLEGFVNWAKYKKGEIF